MKQDAFLFEKTTSTYTSAKEILNCIWEYLGNPKSILDIGCGVGGFSKAFEDRGVYDYHLYDHPTLNLESLLVSNKDRFNAIDLDNDLPEVKKVDIAICTEVVEHLNAVRAEHVVRFLTECADIIIFSAAIPRQGGLGHINEKWHVYWHELFAEFNFEYFDGFKPHLISNHHIDYWLIQNTFIYTKRGAINNGNWPPNISNNRFQIVSNYILNKEYGVLESFALLKKAIVNYLK